MGKIFIKEGYFEFLSLGGTSYNIGKMQGEILKKQPEALKFFTTPNENFGTLSTGEFNDILKLNEEFCPGINDEICGLADSLQVPIENIIYYAATYPRTGHCSHFVTLPQITANGHIYVGRSYEWTWDDELRLCKTKVPGKAAHIGFSLFLFGRFDGMNEYGLCVTMSAAVPGSAPKENGVKFWAIIRSILDNCKTVNDAIYLMKNVPVSFNFNIIVTDRNGEAVLGEIACSKKSFRHIGIASKDKYLCSTNHYTIADMLEFDKNRMWQSAARYNAIQTRISDAIPKVTKDTLKEILSSPVPGGVCCHFYREGLGTLWSMVFDLTDLTVDICFGSPLYNEWNEFSFDTCIENKEFTAKFPDSPVQNPMFWSKLPSGSNL